VALRRVRRLCWWNETSEIDSLRNTKGVGEISYATWSITTVLQRHEPYALHTVCSCPRKCIRVVCVSGFIPSFSHS